MDEQPILTAKNLTKFYGSQTGCLNVSMAVYRSEILALVGESGSGKSTVLNILYGQITPDSGSVLYWDCRNRTVDIHASTEAQRRSLARTELGFVHQNPLDGLNLNVSAGANVAERLLSGGERSYRRARLESRNWLEKVEINPNRLDDRPGLYSGGMRQRLQIAKNLVTGPRLVFLDEPTGGLDLSVQARLLDLIRRLQAELGLAAVLVTHDLGVARLLSQRILVMKDGQIVESGLTDRVLDDPREPYTQLLVSSTLQV
ncbi:MAG: phosphonate C-P lyase system protein PhnK [Deltaproteobacteria bacterium]|jgi:putative phosphonate transport system ATP-binding protein|nr:phosphonate C-P lyase system protein PhnK [Deltaproteobacteria bacterium]